MRYCFFLFVTCSIPVFAGLEDGLVGWWKLDEGSNTTSIDSSDYNRTLSLQNGTSWTAGQINHGVQLDGVDDKLSSPNILVEGNFSVSLWVNPQSSTFLGTESNSVNNSIDPLNRTLIKPLHGGSSSFGLGLSVGTNGVSALLHASSIYCQPLVYTSAISSWVHLALILKNQQPILFVNGALVKTGLVLGRPTKLSVSAGSPIGKGYEEEDHYQGGVDEVRMYDRALSSAEVFHLYALPFDLNSNSPLTLTENSPAGTIVGEFNATDPNGDNVSYALMPALPNVFSPVLWLDANDSSTLIESGGAVSAWQDKSGNDYHFTQNVDNSKCPLYSATSLNGMPSITFDGSNDYLSISSRLGFSSNPDLSVFAVTSFLSLADNDERIFQIGSNSHGLAVTGGIGSWCWRFNGGHERYNDVTINNVAQQAWVRQAGTNYQASRFFYNGLEQARVAGSSDASSPTNVAEIASIGKSTTGSNFANVKISELIVLNDSSEASRRGVETYLARKWGLTYTQPTSDGIFEVESNGTLKSLVSLDRETVSSLPITVRATDPNGNFIEEDFSVTVVDDGLEDTDSDGFLDSVEYQEGSDPISNASIPGLEYGLTAWYPFDGNASDMSGNNRHATAVNSHSYISAKVGSGVRIVGSSSGVTGHVSLPYITSLENSDTTFAFWVLEEAMLQNHGEAYLAYGQLESVLNYSGGQPFSFSSSTSYIAGITRSAWNHYAVTKIGSVKKGYLNGTMVAQGSWTAPSSYSPTFSALGRHWWADGAASSTRLVATFDDLRIYDRALLASEITALQTWTPAVATPLNNAPAILVLSQSQVSENQAVGTSIGQFSAADPDGDTISFNLVQGAGDTGNAYFILETNGSLKTAVTFDFENNASNYSIRVQARDEHNLSTEGNFTLSLLDLDDTVPLVSLNGDSNITHEAGTAYIDANASWTDAVDGSGVVHGSGEVNASVPGVYVLSYDYTDAAGNAAQTVTRTVHVLDSTAPVISLLGDANISHEAETAYIDANASWTDAVDGSGTILASGQVNTGTSGSYVLSFNYTDAAGNAAQTVTRTVHVLDSTAPVISLLGDANISHEAGTAYIDANASWTDSVDGSGVVHASGEVKASDPGVYVLSYDYTDAAGNAAQTITRTVQVLDTSMPVISLLGDANIMHEAGNPYTDAHASWTDAVDGSGTIVASGQVNVGTPGSYLFNYNYTDAAGNAAQTVTRTVVVVDTTAPVISLHGDANITHQAGNVYLDANASWIDAVDGSGVIVANGEVNASDPGTYVLSYNYTDAAGNAAQTVTRTVVVVDTTAPVISLHGDANITHQAGNVYLDANASWIDAVDGLGVIVANGEVNASISGTYVLSFNYTDAAGNAAYTITRTVQVVDSTAPVISLLGDASITHEGGSPYLDANASWTDAVDGSGTILASGQVNAGTPGSYVLSFNYTDAAGNAAQTVTRTVQVVDSTAPVISLLGDANITHEAGNPYIDANASWTDGVDGSGIILASGKVNPSIPGTYLLGYDYTDAAGNGAQTVTRKVEVINLSPNALYVQGDSNLSIFENEPNGTWVANFEGLDGNPDHVLFYELVRVSDGNQSAEQNASYGNLPEPEHFNVFHLDSNGSLTTLRPIDYEIDPLEFEIVIRVTDQHGAYFVAPFLVNVLNVVEDLDNDGIEDHYDLDDDGDGYPDEVEKTYGFNPRERWEYPEVPIVRTLELIEEGNETLRFGMEILAEGGFEKLQVGIEIFDLSGNLLLEKVFEWNATSVAKVTFLEDGFFRGQVIRYQAYAENLAGRTSGQLMEYRVGGEMDAWWASDLELTGGWRESIWMGTYLPNLKNNWIYHLKLGWLFIEVDQQGGYWMWMSNNGWLWTNQETWPFLWANETADWLYPVYSGNKLYFYDYQIESFR
ncbi:DUF5011 domain-containing protein [Opitutales bacterium]|nr:DUF5011 domain-containing protein [Opitutales bacterium]